MNGYTRYVLSRLSIKEGKRQRLEKLKLKNMLKRSGKKKFEVWSWSLKLKLKFEVEVWSWNMKYKFEVEL